MDVLKPKKELCNLCSKQKNIWRLWLIDEKKKLQSNYLYGIILSKRLFNR